MSRKSKSPPEPLNLARAEKHIREKYHVPEDARLGWHFISEDRKLRYDDGRVVEVGQTLSAPDGKRPRTCDYGMHASPTVQQAIEYMPKSNAHLCLVWVQGQIDEDDDKFCGKSRHCIAMIDHATYQIAYQQYEAVERPAWEQYEAVERPAWERYEAVKRPAREQYEAVKRTAREQYEAVERPAWEQLEFDILTAMGVFEAEGVTA